MARYRDTNLALTEAQQNDLRDLLLEREAILAESPSLRAFQQELNRMMTYCYDPNLRLESLCMLLEDKLNELIDAIQVAQQAASDLE